MQYNSLQSNKATRHPRFYDRALFQRYLSGYDGKCRDRTNKVERMRGKEILHHDQPFLVAEEDVAIHRRFAAGESDSYATRISQRRLQEISPVEELALNGPAEAYVISHPFTIMAADAMIKLEEAGYLVRLLDKEHVRTLQPRLLSSQPLIEHAREWAENYSKGLRARLEIDGKSGTSRAQLASSFIPLATAEKPAGRYMLLQYAAQFQAPDSGRQGELPISELLAVHYDHLSQEARAPIHSFDLRTYWDEFPVRDAPW